MSLNNSEADINAPLIPDTVRARGTITPEYIPSYSQRTGISPVKYTLRERGTLAPLLIGIACSQGIALERVRAYSQRAGIAHTAGLDINTVPIIHESDDPLLYQAHARGQNKFKSEPNKLVYYILETIKETFKIQKEKENPGLVWNIEGILAVIVFITFSITCLLQAIGLAQSVPNALVRIVDLMAAFLFGRGSMKVKPLE